MKFYLQNRFDISAQHKRVLEETLGIIISEFFFLNNSTINDWFQGILSDE